MWARLSSGRRRYLGAFGTPLLYAAAAVVLGVAIPRLEAYFLPNFPPIFDAASAIAVLGSIAAGMLPLTGLVYSLAFVLVQFSATAYSPRLVSWLAGSAFMSHALGIFTATFIYSLAALGWVNRGGTGKVPMLTVWFAIALLLASVVFFVMLVERLEMLQISRVLAWTGDQGRTVIARDFAPLDRPGGPSRNADAPDELPAVRQVLVHRGGPAVIQAIDVERLVALAAKEDVVVAMALAVGDTVMDGMPLLRVHGGSRPVADDRLRALVRLGAERTFEQDPKYALRILVDISIKALSPAINDPTTAVQALDQVEDLLLRLGRTSLSAGRLRDDRGDLRLTFPVPSWDDFLVLAFDEIRFCGESSIQVMRRLRALLHGLIEQVPPARRPALERYLARVDSGTHRAFVDEEDRRDALEEDRQGLGLSRQRRASIDPPPGGPAAV